MQEELALLQRFHGDAQHAELNGEDWIRLETYPFPAGWKMGENSIESGPVIFRLAPGYPTDPPYGFCIPSGMTFNDGPPNNCSPAPASPFPGTWIQFSWQQDGNWAPTTQTDRGSNLLSWVRSFFQRLQEGV